MAIAEFVRHQPYAKDRSEEPATYRQTSWRLLTPQVFYNK